MYVVYYNARTRTVNTPISPSPVASFVFHGPEVGEEEGGLLEDLRYVRTHAYQISKIHITVPGTELSRAGPNWHGPNCRGTQLSRDRVVVDRIVVDRIVADRIVGTQLS